MCSRRSTLARGIWGGDGLGFDQFSLVVRCRRSLVYFGSWVSILLGSWYLKTRKHVYFDTLTKQDEPALPNLLFVAIQKS